MFNEIWEGIKEVFTFVYDRIVKILIKPMYITLSLFSLYCFINYMIHYEILLAFANLFAAIVFFKLLEGSE